MFAIKKIAAPSGAFPDAGNSRPVFALGRSFLNGLTDWLTIHSARLWLWGCRSPQGERWLRREPCHGPVPKGVPLLLAECGGRALPVAFALGV